MRLLILILAASSLSGCVAQQQTSFTSSSGRVANTARCSVSPRQCFQQASQVCAGTYQVLDSDSHAGGIAADLIAGETMWYSLTYQCGRSDGSKPDFAFRGPPLGSGTPGMGAGLSPASENYDNPAAATLGAGIGASREN